MALFRMLGCLVMFGFIAGYATSARGVIKRSSRPESRIDWITTAVASRAHSDVRMRRLLQMFAAKKINYEQFHQRLQDLKQQDRH